MNYINTFLFYSIIGHAIENQVYTKVDSGILYGYWTPIYGLGVLAMLLLFKMISKWEKNKLLRVIFLFLSAFFTIGILEFFGGMFIEKVYGRIFWDYSNHALPIGRYTSLGMMFLWGISSVLVVYLINPFVDIILKKIPKSLTIALALLFLYDLFYTLMMLKI